MHSPSTDRLIRLSAIAAATAGLLLFSSAVVSLPRTVALADSTGIEAAAQQHPTSPLHDAINETLGLIRSDLAHLDIAAVPGESFEVALTLDGEPATLSFWPHTVLAPGFKVRAQIDDGSLVDVDAGPELTLRGTVAELPESNVAGGISGFDAEVGFGTGVNALILLADGRRIWIEHVAPHFPDALPGEVDPALHVVYLSEDLIDHGGVCGVTGQAVERFAPVAQLNAEAPDQTAGSEGGIAGSPGTYCVNIAFDADFQFYQIYNNSVNLVVNRITNIINAVNVQYENEVQIKHQITEIIVRTSSNQPYTSTSAGTLLNQFRSTWNTQPEWSIQRHVAHLFTGKNLGGTLGVAYLGVVCNKNMAYGLSRNMNVFSWATDLTSHEIGHNWNASHCSCPNHTMNPSITGANAHHSSSISTIINFRNNVSCPASCVPPPPINNTCLTSLVVPEGSTEFTNVHATTEGPNEPGICSFSGDSNVQSDVWFRHTSACTGELTVSLCESLAGFDTKLAVYAGAGCPTTSGTAMACNKNSCGQLSSLTFHVNAGEVYRIRIGGHQGAQGEGVLTISCEPDEIPCPADLTGTGAVDVFDLLQLLAAWGSCAGCSEDLTKTGNVDVFDLLQLLAEWGACP